MTGRAALVAVVTLGLLMGCSAPSTHPSGSGSPTTSATQSTTASANASSSTSGVKQSATVASTSAATSSKSTASTAWTLSINGLGPLKLGTTYGTLRQQGYVTPETGDCPGSWTSQALQDKGVYLYPSGTGDSAVLIEVSVTKATYATVSGAKVGYTVSQLKKVYGTQLTIETKNGNGGPFKVANVHIGAREIVFYFPYGATIADTDVVQAMIARNWSADMMGEC